MHITTFIFAQAQWKDAALAISDDLQFCNCFMQNSQWTTASQNMTIQCPNQYCAVY